MGNFSVIINDKTSKGKHIIRLLKEMAKTESFIEVGPVPNSETVKAILDVKEKNNLTKAKDKNDFFAKLNA
jgi:hypothetical protein